MAALALRPHLKRSELQLRFGYLDFVLLLSWWVFLYAFVVLPWMYAEPALEQYNYTYVLITNIQNSVAVIGLGVLWLHSRGAWRTVYANLFGAAAMYMISSLLINVAISLKAYYTGSLYDLPLVASFLWFGAAGLIAYKNGTALDDSSDVAAPESADQKKGESILASRLAMAAVVSLPVFAIYTMKFAHDSSATREFRLMTILLAAVPLGFLVFLRQHLADRDRARLLARAELSVENLQRLQAQLVQTEKLVSLGQLAAGAAHEINNPLTAILGYSDLLADDASLSEKPRAIAGKIRDQARRTKTLVGNLLSFARQVPAERTLRSQHRSPTQCNFARSICATPAAKSISSWNPYPGVRGDEIN
jgi:signal transduction histidine kinase